jgi:hypothetical protein
MIPPFEGQGKVNNPGPEDPPSPGYGAAGPGFDFNPKGWCLPIDTHWNSGMMGQWNVGFEKRIMF